MVLGGGEAQDNELKSHLTVDHILKLRGLKMYREPSCFLAGGRPLSNPSGFPGVAFAFPQDKSFLLLPAAVACNATHRPCHKSPPFLLVTDPLYVQPNRCSAEVNSGRLCLSLL